MSERARRTLVRSLALAAVLPALTGALTACGLTEPDPTLQIGVDGRLERGLELTLEARLDGRPLEAGRVTWTAEPAGAASFDGASIRLLEAGPLTLTARTDEARADTALQVAVPPSIVFDAVDGGNRDVFRAALDGRDVVRLTSDPGEDEDPSAAAGTVVFTSWRTGGADLWTVAVDGGSAARLDALATNADERQPALSADGGRVAFVRSEGGFPGVRTATLAGESEAAPTEGTAVAGGVEASPAWAPDGGRVALMSTVAGDADLYAVDAGEGAATVLVAGDGPQVEPAWSPDGDAVVYVASADGDAELFRLEVASGASTRLTSRPGADGQPAVLPDGRVVYTAWTGSGSELRWLDPERPAESVRVPLELELPENPAAVRP